MVQSYLKQNFSFILKVASQLQIPGQDQSLVYEERTSFLRALRDNHVDYSKNCIFLDGCKLFKNEVKVAAKESKKKKDSFVSLGNFVCFCAEGVIGFSQEAFLLPAKKKHPNVEMLGPAQGTRIDHFRQFVVEVIQILDERQRTGLYFVMENLAWSSDRKVIEAIKQAGHIPVVIPAMSSSMIPTESFWVKVKNEVGKAPFKSPKDNLVERIEQVVNSVNHSDCQSWITECVKTLEDQYPQEQ